MLIAMEVVLAFASISTVVILLLKWVDHMRTERLVARRLELICPLGILSTDQSGIYPIPIDRG
jgi:hypothetical protein